MKATASPYWRWFPLSILNFPLSIQQNVPDIFTITVNGRERFSCHDDQTIIEAGQQAGFGFPVACRNGVCERCMGTLQR